MRVGLLSPFGQLLNNGSFNDLVVNFKVGDENYLGSIISGTSLGNNSFELKVRLSNKVALGTAKIVLTRLQKERFGTEVTDIQTVNYDSNSIRLSASNGYVLATQPLDDSVVALQGTNPEAVVETTSSSDLLVARIPVGTEGKVDLPRDIAFTPLGDRAYVTLERSDRIALVDPLILQQIDTNPETEAIDLIDLPTGSEPYSIAIDQQSQYAYITDRRLGVIYVLDINPYSQTYHQLIQNIQVDFAPNGLRGLAISSDGRKLFATAPNFGWGDSKVIVINIDPKDKPNSPSQNSRRWHQQIGAIDTHRGAEGISASSDPLKMTFTNRKSDATGFGVLEVTNADSLNFAATSRYTDLTLGNINDYF